MIISHKGKDVEVIPVEIISQEELWNTYQLADGTVIRVKPIMKDIFKIKDKLGTDGKPMYITKADVVVHLRGV